MRRLQFLLYYLIRFFEVNIDYFFQITIFILLICLFLKLIYWYGIKRNSESENLSKNHDIEKSPQ